jgi:hypothetical protein
MPMLHAGQPECSVRMVGHSRPFLSVQHATHVLLCCHPACVVLLTELAEAAAAGIPISPSLSGPHAEEQMTQMEVFLKQYKYPEHKCFLL